MTRPYAGRVNGDPGTAPYGHVCLAYDDRAELTAHARDFLAAGRAAGEQVRYIAVTASGEVDAPFVPLHDTYRDGEVVDPLRQVAAYTRATGEALAAGYTGLRVVADATPLVRTAAQLDAFARYEHLIDRYMRDHPFTALCAYDRAELGDAVVAQLACLHAATNAGVPFRLHACAPGEGSAELAGELDVTGGDLLTATLQRTDLRPAGGGDVVLRADRLTFADHRSLLRLQEHAERRGTTIVLRGASRGTARLAALLDLSRLRVEAAA